MLMLCCRKLMWHELHLWSTAGCTLTDKNALSIQTRVLIPGMCYWVGAQNNRKMDLSFWYFTDQCDAFWMNLTGTQKQFLSDRRHACSKVIYRVSVSIHTGSPNSLNTHRQAHTSCVQWSLEVISCVSGAQYLHRDGWKHTVLCARITWAPWHTAWDKGRNNTGD